MPKGVPNLPTDALTAQHFAIEIAGVEVAQFSEFSGGAIEVEVLELKENTTEGKLITHKAPGVTKWPTLTLKRALNSSTDLEDWFKAASEGRVVDAGQLVVEIGIAPVKPAEFVIFRIAQFSGGASVAE